MKLRKKNKLVFGVGVNDADYNVYKYEVVGGKQKIVWICPFYRTWCHMLERSYDPKLHKRVPTYLECSTVPSWLLFSGFKSWMELQDWEGKELDKDTLIPGNKLYGPDTCVFVSRNVNLFTRERKASRGEFPIGVSYHKINKKYKASCWSVETGKQESLGYYSCPEEAHSVWLAFKLEQAYILANQQTDQRVARALIERYENYVSL